MSPLENDKNVYILGAGFSRPRGLPLISDFMFMLRDARDWLIDQKRTEEASAVQAVLEFRRDSMPAAYRVNIDLENIEELFSLAAATNDMSYEIRLAIAATLDYCALKSPPPVTSFEIEEREAGVLGQAERVLAISQTRDQRVFATLPMYVFLVSALIGRFSGQVCGGNSFVSLNYDLCLEEALDAINQPFTYCLHGCSDEMNSESADGSLPVPLLKLHGSINWGYRGGRSSSLDHFDSYATLRSRCETGPELIPPTWHKSVASQLASVWSRALEEISSATRIVVIGFSMPATDLHFKYLLAAGLRQNISLREIVFVDVARTALEARAAELFGDLTKRPRIRILTGGVEGFVSAGTIAECIWSINRPLVGSMQHVCHGR